MDTAITSRNTKRQIKLERSVGKRDEPCTSLFRKRSKLPTSSEDSSTESQPGEFSAFDSDFSGPQRSTRSQARIPLSNAAEAAIRMGVSRRAAALIISSTLEDVGLVTAENKDRVVD